MTFYLRLFIAFVFLSIIILGFASFSFNSFYKSSSKKVEEKQILKTLLHQEHMLHNIFSNVKRKLHDVKSSSIFNDYSDSKDEKTFRDLLKTIISSHSEFIQISFISLDGKEQLKINRSITEPYFTKKIDLESQKTENYFKQIRSLAIGEIWVSDFTVLKKEGEIKLPIDYCLRFIIRTQKGFLTFVLDAKKVFSKIEHSFDSKSYIVDKDGYFLIHKNYKYNWSKYFAPNITIYTLYPSLARGILNTDVFRSDNFISKKVYLTEDKFIVILVNYDEEGFVKNLEELEEYFFSIIMIGLTISVLLSMFFSSPIAKLNEKIIKRNKDLDISFKKSTRKLSASLDIIDKYVMAFQLDSMGIITNVSNALCEKTGYLKEELIGQHHRVLISSDIEDEEYSKIWENISNGVIHFPELKSMKKDGTIYWVESFIEPVFDEDNNVKAFNTIRNDITDKKRVETLYKDINYQIEQYNAIFENANSGIGLIDLEGNFRKVNATFCNLLGYTNEELLNKNCYEMVPENSINILRKIVDEAYEINFISNMEKIFIHKEGKQVHLELYLSLLPDKNHFVFIVNSLEDKRKLQELNSNLHEKVKTEVEKNLQKDKLHQEEQIRNAKLTSIGSLAAGITHEINTPLTYIKGNFEMMGYDIEDLPNSEIRTRMLEDSVKINDGLNRIASIVESMREMSQSSTEGVDEVNIYSTLVTALTMAYNRSKQVTRIYLNDTIFTIDNINKNEFEFLCNVQKQRIEQVWIVIINNALDELIKIDNYEQRELKINISQDNDDVVVVFSDNAGGINEDIIDNIFEPFISSKDHSGVGIGLNIAKKIIDEHNGKLVAKNIDNGAQFEVRLKKHASC